jgi:hypothetical protein
VEARDEDASFGLFEKLPTVAMRLILSEWHEELCRLDLHVLALHLHAIIVNGKVLVRDHVDRRDAGEHLKNESSWVIESGTCLRNVLQFREVSDLAIDARDHQVARSDGHLRHS